MERRDWSGPNFEYVVQYRPSPVEGREHVEGEEEFKDIVISDPEQSHIVLPADGPYKSYEVRVRSRNSEGYSSATPATIKGYSGEESKCLFPVGFLSLSEIRIFFILS